MVHHNNLVSRTRAERARRRGLVRTRTQAQPELYRRGGTADPELENGAAELAVLDLVRVPRGGDGDSTPPPAYDLSLSEGFPRAGQDVWAVLGVNDPAWQPRMPRDWWAASPMVLSRRLLRSPAGRRQVTSSIAIVQLGEMADTAAIPGFSKVLAGGLLLATVRAAVDGAFTLWEAAT